MFRIWKYTLFFLLCLVVALLFNLPVQQVLPYVQLPPNLQVVGVDGSILKGSAAELRIDDFPIRDIRYRYMPSCIAKLKVCYHIRYKRGDIRVAYDVLNGDSEVSRSEIEYPVADLLRLLPNPALVKPTGRLKLHIDDLSMQQDKLVSVNGKLIWRNLGLDDEGIRIDIGDYQVDFRGDPESYEFTFSDLDADLDIDGKGKISSSGDYEVDVMIESGNGIDPHVKSVLNVVARRITGNKYRIKQKGRLSAEATRQLFR